MKADPGSVHIKMSEAKGNERSAVLVLHGGPGLSRRYLVPTFEFLVRNSRAKVGLVDLPNHGSSWHSSEDLLDFPMALKGLTRAVENIVESVDRTLIIGHSLGGVMGLEVAASLPCSQSISLCHVLFQVRFASCKANRPAGNRALPDA